MRSIQKRFFCIILALLIGVMSMPAAVASENNDEPEIIDADSILEYAEALSDIVDEQDDLENYEKDENYSTNRVIISASDVKSIDFDIVSPETILFNEDDDTAVLQFSTKTQAQECIDYYSDYPGVEFAEMDEIVETQELPERIVYPANENMRGSILSWGVTSSHVDTYVDNLIMQNIGLSRQVTVAVIDSGIDSSHSRLKDRIASGGFDLVNSDSDPNDSNGHGTHVSGTILDCVGDLNVKILPLKVFEGREGSTALIATAVKYAASQRVDIINMSLGGDKHASTSSDLDKQIKNAISAGVTVCVAAGNETSNTSTKCPAHLSEPIVVSAIDSSNNFADFSNYGSSVDFAAPGVNIYNTYPTNSYAYLSGTSMATPHISGFAAVLKAQYPDVSPSTLENGLRNLCDDLGTAGRDNYFGYGKINFNNCVIAKSHSSGDWQVFREPTCTVTGVRIKKCTYCSNITAKETISKKAHEYTTYETPATCTTAGKVTRVCDVCGRTEVVSTTPASHTPGQSVTENYTYPTCTAAGGYDEVCYCTVCGAETSRTHISFEQLAHTIVEDKGYAATCTSEGLTDGSHCSVCNTVIVPQTVIPKGEHVSGEEVIENNVQATCVVEGSYDTVCYCTVCGQELSRTATTTPKTDHTVVEDKGYSATCTNDGLTNGSHCSVCNTVIVPQTVIPKQDHVPGRKKTENRVEATCSAAGSYDSVYYCLLCGGEVSRTTTEIPKISHTVVNDTGYAATCTTDGLTDGSHCSVCGEIIVAQEKIAKTGHTPQNISGKAPTCTQSGYSSYVKCSVCGQNVTEPEVLSATGHRESDWIVTVPATYNSEGTRIKQCQVCSIVLETETIPSLGSPQMAAKDGYDITIDSDKKLIIGVPQGSDNLSDCISFESCTPQYTLNANGFGTGSFVTLNNDDLDFHEQYTIVVSGDLTGDGFVDSFDVAVAMEYVNSFEEPEDPSYKAAADIYSDGYIDATDLAYMMYIANFENNNQ